jgi:hypothetical protein
VDARGGERPAAKPGRYLAAFEVAEERSGVPVPGRRARDAGLVRDEGPHPGIRGPALRRSRLSHSPPRLGVNPQSAPGIWLDVRIGRSDRGRYIPNVQVDKALWEVVRQPRSRPRPAAIPGLGRTWRWRAAGRRVVSPGGPADLGTGHRRGPAPGPVRRISLSRPAPLPLPRHAHISDANTWSQSG